MYNGEKRNVILDPYDQLTSAARTNGPNGAADAAYDFGYQYDEVGNRLHEDRKDFDLDATFNALNQLTYRDWNGRLAVYGSVDDTNAVMIVGGVTSAPPYFNSTNWLGGGAVNSAGSNSIPIVANVGTNSTQTNLTVYMPPEKPQEFSWDQNGNLTNDGYRAYSWNNENRLVEIETDVGAVLATAMKKSTFLYDGLGRRSQKTDYSGWNGSTYSATNVTTFTWDGWLLLQEQSASGGNVTTNHYVWGQDLSGSLQGAGGIGGLLCVVRNGTPYFPCFDGNGNVTEYIDATGAIVAHREYDPFGRTILSSGPMKNAFSFWFSTKYEEPFWKIYYYGKRYYQSQTGCWLNRDRIGEKGGVNLYSFVENFPIVLVDPHGLMSWFERRAALAFARRMLRKWLKEYDDDFCVVIESDINAFLLEGERKWVYTYYPHLKDIPATYDEWLEWIAVNVWGRAWITRHHGLFAKTRLGKLQGPKDTCQDKCTETLFSWGGPVSHEEDYKVEKAERPALKDWVGTLDLQNMATQAFIDKVLRLRFESDGDIHVRRIVPCECEEH